MNCFSFPRIFYSGTRKSPRKRWWLVVAVWICLPALAWGQEQKVTVDLRDAKVQEVLMEIKRQTGLNFVYSPEQLAALPARDVEAKDETVDALMERLLEGSGLEHAFEMGSTQSHRRGERQGGQSVAWRDRFAERNAPWHGDGCGRYMEVGLAGECSKSCFGFLLRWNGNERSCLYRTGCY